MKWGSPSNLALWILFVVGAAFALRDQRRAVQAFASVVSRELWPRLLSGWDPLARARKLMLWSAALFMLLLAMARPQWGAREEVVKTTGLDLMLVLDLSRSMDVEDVVPSRMKKARHLIRSILGRMGGDRVGVVAFAGGSYVASPLTNDLNYVQEVVDVLAPGTLNNQGTDIGLGLETAAATLERGAESSENPEAQKSFPTRALLLITDGEDQEGAAERMAEKLREKSIRVFVMGVGSQRGGPIPVRDDDGKLQGYKKKGNEPILSRLETGTLEKIASASGGSYWTATDSEVEVDEFLEKLGALDRTQSADKKILVPQERFQWFVAIGILLLLIEYWIPLSRRARPVLLWLVVIGAAASSASREASAVTVGGYLKNRAGVSSYQSGDLAGAKQKFGSAQAADPTSVEPVFNQGVVELKGGDAEQALKSFESASRQAKLKGDAELSGAALYNMGSAQEKSQDLGAAIRNFAESIRMARISGDQELEVQARRRIEKLQQEKQKQDQQKQDQQKQQQGSDRSDQKQSSNPKQDENQDNKKDEKKNPDPQQAQKPFEDPSVSRKRQTFKSEKLSQEDSDRVMAELSQREKELQARLKKQRGARASSNGRDW